MLFTLISYKCCRMSLFLFLFIIVIVNTCLFAVCREVLRTDLAFFLDSSASLGSENFVKTKQFIKTIANAFDVSPANTHVSVITYASENKIEFDFQRYMDQRDLFQAIDNIPYRSGRFTYIDAALLTADRRVFTAENRARPDAFRVGFDLI